MYIFNPIPTMKQVLGFVIRGFICDIPILGFAYVLLWALTFCFRLLQHGRDILEAFTSRGSLYRPSRKTF